jgi:hypothetical protein
MEPEQPPDQGDIELLAAAIETLKEAVEMIVDAHLSLIRQQDEWRKREAHYLSQLRGILTKTDHLLKQLNI